MATQIPPPPRSPRVLRALTRTQNLSNHLRIHPMRLIIPHVPNDHSIHLVPPNILLIILPLLENPLTIPHHLVSSLTILLLYPFLESRPNLATVPLSPRAPSKHITETARSRGAQISMLPPRHPTTRNPNSPPHHPPFLTIPLPAYPEVTPVRRVSSLLPRRLTKPPSSSPVFLRRVRLMKLLPRDLRLTAGRRLCPLRIPPPMFPSTISTGVVPLPVLSLGLLLALSFRNRL